LMLTSLLAVWLKHSWSLAESLMVKRENQYLTSGMVWDKGWTMAIPAAAQRVSAAFGQMQTVSSGWKTSHREDTRFSLTRRSRMMYRRDPLCLMLSIEMFRTC